MPNQAKDVVRGLWAVFATGSRDPEAEQKLIAPTCLDHDPMSKDPTTDLVTQWFTPLRALFPDILDAFPEIHSSFDALVAEGDRVVLRGSERGVFSSPFRGEAPTGSLIKVTVINIFRIENSQIAERWGAVDLTPFFETFGKLDLKVKEQALS